MSKSLCQNYIRSIIMQYLLTEHSKKRINSLFFLALPAIIEMGLNTMLGLKIPP